jgi:hypothetical protein
MTLTNCRAFDNATALTAETQTTGSATIRLANCVVTQNNIGFQTFPGSGTATVIGTNPGTNLIVNDFNNGPLSSSVTLQ